MTKKKEKSAKKPKIERQKRLPGMEDAKIESIQDAVMDYAEIRDRRQELTTEEVALKTKLLNLMKQHGKTSYTYHGVHVELVVEEETVKVRIKKEDSDSD
jgi:hypothetical protein